MNKFMKAMEFAEKQGRQIISTTNIYSYNDTGFTGILKSWLFTCYEGGHKVTADADLPRLPKTKHQVDSLWGSSVGGSIWENTIAESLGFSVSEPEVKTYNTTQRVYLEATQEDIVEYLLTLPKLTLSKMFKAGFTDQGYVYDSKYLHDTSLLAVLTIVNDAENFTFTETSHGQSNYQRTMVIPKGAPKSRLATNKKAALKSKIGKFITEDFPGALNAAYGGDWKELQPTEAYWIANDFNRRKYRQTMLEEEFEKTEKDLVAMIDYLEKVQEQNDKLKVMVADAGGSRPFKKKLTQDLIDKAPLEAVVWANHENPMLQDISVTILGG